MSVYVPVSLRRQVRIDARCRCGYCQSAEFISGIKYEVEHLLPLALGGRTVRENLWLACPHCNPSKKDRTEAIDPVTSLVTPLYNPRQQSWYDHFCWSSDGILIIGISAIGRATVQALHMNNDYVVTARRFWVAVGRHPPSE